MNIFVTDPDPVVCARVLPDKHIVKMPLECCQMLSIVASEKWGHGFGTLPKADGTPYATEKGAFRNHPCTVWAGVNRANYTWLADHALALCEQFVKRFDKVHSCCKPILTLTSLTDLLPTGIMTPFAQAMPDEHKHEDAVVAYRSYYRTKEFAAWDKGTPAPKWW